MPPNNSKPFHIAILIVPPIQLLDIGPIDLFSMLIRSYFTACNFPAPLIASAIADANLRLTYVSPDGPNSVADTTAHLGLYIDAGLDDAVVGPGKVDLLMIPGPPPGLRPSEDVLRFVRSHVEAGVELMTICSGVFVAAYAGVLDGKKATGTRGVMDMLEREFPKVEWVDKRYMRDGKIWSSGGITNGMDLAGVYIKQKWPELADIVLTMADVEVRSEEYGESQVAVKAWFGWQILKAWVKSILGSKKS